MTRPLFAFAAPAFAILALASAGTASAQTACEGDCVKTSLTVPYGDLNLNSGEGAAKLTRRIRLAADDVCGGQPTSVAERGANADYKACTGQAIAAAVEAVGSTRLYATAEGRRLLTLAAR